MSEDDTWPSEVEALYDGAYESWLDTFVEGLTETNQQALVRYRQWSWGRDPEQVAADLLRTYFGADSGEQVDSAHVDEIGKIEWGDAQDGWDEDRLAQEPRETVERLNAFADREISTAYQQFVDNAYTYTFVTDDASEAASELADPSGGDESGEDYITEDQIVADDDVVAAADAVDDGKLDYRKDWYIRLAGAVGSAGLNKSPEALGDFLPTAQAFGLDFAPMVAEFRDAILADKDAKPAATLSDDEGNLVAIAAERLDYADRGTVLMFTVQVALVAEKLLVRNVRVAADLLEAEGHVRFTQCGGVIVLGESEDDVVLSAARLARFHAEGNGAFGWLVHDGSTVTVATDCGGPDPREQLDEIGQCLGLSPEEIRVQKGTDRAFLDEYNQGALKSLEEGGTLPFVYFGDTLAIRYQGGSERQQRKIGDQWNLLVQNGGIEGSITMERKGGVRLREHAGSLQVTIAEDGNFKAAIRRFSQKAIHWNVAA